MLIMSKHPDEVFFVNYSKLKLGLSIFSMSAIGLLSLCMGVIILSILLDVQKFNVDALTYFFAMLVALIGALYTFNVARKYAVILFKNVPMTVLNHHGYGGVGFKTWHNYNWTPKTKFRYNKTSWAYAASIHTLKHTTRPFKEMQSASEYVSIPLHLSNRSLKDVKRAYEYFNPFHQEAGLQEGI